MNFNPVRLGYRDYTTPSISSFGEVVVEHAACSGRRMRLPSADGAEYVSARIESMEMLETAWRRVCRVRLDRVFSFRPGDSAGILCPNNNLLVDAMMDILGIEDFECSIERTTGVVFAYSGTARDFFKHHFDFTGLPRKAMLMRLGRSCSDAHRREIEYLCSREGTRDYLAMGMRWNNVIDFMRTFECKPMMEDVVGDCEIIKPRHFSLVNRAGEPAEILIGLTSKDFDGFVRYGHVSDFLVSAGAKDIQVYLRANSLFQMDSSPKMLAVCTGTGIAPFLSFVRNLQPHQRIWILYGFRNSEDDLSTGIDADERVQITRMQSSNGVYVTDYIGSHVDALRAYIGEDSPVYVCGRMDMQRMVFRVFEEHFKDVVQSKRLIFDLWS